MPRAAIVLSGCGVFDGSEIHEAVSVFVHLSRAGAEVSFYAPDVQAPVVNHLTGKPEAGQTRSVLAESARIARGKIKPLADLKAGSADAVFFPGGFGAAKNLCDFANKGAACTVHPEVERVVKEFHAAKKPIAMCCIAPVIAARVLGAEDRGGCRLTVGGASDASAAVEKMGARHVASPVEGAVVDEANLLVTSPAYMCDAAPHEVYEGIGAMVEKTLELAGAHARAR